MRITIWTRLRWFFLVARSVCPSVMNFFAFPDPAHHPHAAKIALFPAYWNTVKLVQMFANRHLFWRNLEWNVWGESIHEAAGCNDSTWRRTKGEWLRLAPFQNNASVGEQAIQQTSTVTIWLLLTRRLLRLGCIQNNSMLIKAHAQ